MKHIVIMNPLHQFTMIKRLDNYKYFIFIIQRNTQSNVYLMPLP